MAALDNGIDAVMRDWFGRSTGLLLTGSVAALVFAYLVRFLAVSLGAFEAGLTRITPSLSHAARTLGRGPLRASSSKWTCRSCGPPSSPPRCWYSSKR